MLASASFRYAFQQRHGAPVTPVQLQEGRVGQVDVVWARAQWLLAKTLATAAATVSRGRGGAAYAGGSGLQQQDVGVYGRVQLKRGLSTT